MDGRFLLMAGFTFPVFRLVEPLSHALFTMGIRMLATAGICDVLDLRAE
ncbi:hypothetical protein [Haloquadratum walsbyi]|uniref:Uncharacterized protein n=1 Tax=Haloquadratum walsbyi J07HQW2 TaxID=1238425 RepID=U1NC95_9EURY|nr:hypothetical protein [Haloquadratum walsbyi]ERG94303.1 MAG: hypothetical protein J07HQW2_00737 [Haloquadratum walsbyi J07HQW2]